MWMYINLGLIILGFIIFAILLVFAVIIVIIAIYRKFALRYEITHDVAQVVDKDFNDDLCRQILEIRTGCLGLYVNYNVYILYKGEKHCFNDLSLYEKVEIGDNVNILVHKGFNKRGELKFSYLRIED